MSTAVTASPVTTRETSSPRRSQRQTLSLFRRPQLTQTKLCFPSVKTSSKSKTDGTKPQPTNPETSEAISLTYSNSFKQNLFGLTEKEIEVLNKKQLHQSNLLAAQTNTKTTSTTKPAEFDPAFTYDGLSGEALVELNKKAEEEALLGIRKSNRAYTLQKFAELGRRVERSLGLSFGDIEDGRSIKAANTSVANSDSKDQDKAQYGRTMWVSGDKILSDFGDIKSDGVFVDIGHGIGNLCFQAAYTKGCTARGIELIESRNIVSKHLQQEYEFQHNLLSTRENLIRKVGKIDLRHGQLQLKKHRRFITEGVDLIYCNNFNDVFGSRSNNKSNITHCPDDFIAGLLTQMKPGAKLITLHPLGMLRPPIDEANSQREKMGLKPHPSASFYRYRQVEEEGGEDRLNWTDKPFKYFIYERVGAATFLCDNPACERAKNSVPIQAWKLIDEGDDEKERLVPVTECPVCKMGTRSKRARKIKDYGVLAGASKRAKRNDEARSMRARKPIDYFQMATGRPAAKKP